MIDTQLAIIRATNAMVGVDYPRSDTDFWDAYIKYTPEYAEQLGLSLRTTNSQNDIAKLAANTQTLILQGAEAIAMAPQSTFAIAPILAQIIQLVVSRQREYLADASAVQFTRNPLGLASALRKIDDDPDVLEAANRGTAHLYIANPIKKFEERASTMFASHPPIKDRIARLEALAHQTGPVA